MTILVAKLAYKNYEINRTKVLVYQVNSTVVRMPDTIFERVQFYRLIRDT